MRECGALYYEDAWTNVGTLMLPSIHVIEEHWIHELITKRVALIDLTKNVLLENTHTTI